MFQDRNVLQFLQAQLLKYLAGFLEVPSSVPVESLLILRGPYIVECYRLAAPVTGLPVQGERLIKIADHVCEPAKREVNNPRMAHRESRSAKITRSAVNVGSFLMMG